MTKSHFVALVAVLVVAGFAHAQEVVDQQNDPTSKKSFSCGKTPILNKSILQSFVPAQDNLSAIEVRLRAGDSFPSADQTVTIRVRDGRYQHRMEGSSHWQASPASREVQPGDELHAPPLPGLFWGGSPRHRLQQPQDRSFVVRRQADDRMHSWSRVYLCSNGGPATGMHD